MKDQLLIVIENSRNYTLSVAEAMPGTLYNFKHVDAVWNFGELLNHIAYGICWWTNNYVKRTDTAWEPPTIKNQRTEILKDLDDAYDFLKTSIPSEINDEVLCGIHSTINHITHHRGQAVLQLRLKGIVPPDYIY